MSKKIISIGVVSKAHGLKGHVILIPAFRDNKVFENLNTVVVNDYSQKELHIESISLGEKGHRVKFREINNRNESEALAKKEIAIWESKQELIQNGAEFIAEMIDSIVLNQHGDTVGIVTDVLQAKMYDMYVVLSSRDQKEYYIPAVNAFILSVNQENKQIIINEIPGLLT